MADSDDIQPKGEQGSGGGAEMDRRGGDRRRVERRVRVVPVTVDRRKGRDRRTGLDRRSRQGPGAYDLAAEELEFINAINAFKRKSGRSFPTWSEVLQIVRELGYRRPDAES